MDDGGPTASFIVFFMLLFIDMLFYGFGEAVKELNSKELSEQYAQTKNKKTKRLYEIAVSPGQYINTVQLVVTLINLVMGGFFLRVFGRIAGNLLEKGAGEWFEGRVISPGMISVIALILAGAVLLYILLC